MRCVAFDLGLSLGEVTKISDQREDATPALENAFTWRIRCNGERVAVYALDRKKVERIGTARWANGELTACEGKSDTLPNDYQWDLVAYGLGKALGEAVRGRGRDALERRRNRAPAVPKPAELTPAQIAAHERQAAWRVKRKLSIGALVIAAVASIAIIIVFTREKKRPEAPPSAPATPITPPTRSAKPPPPIEQRVANARTLAEAIELTGSRFGDGANNAGAWLLARFASRRMVWEDVALATPETTIGLVLKDSERERGKRLCASGVVGDIERKDLDRRPVYVGTLETAEGDGIRFIAVGSTGSLVKRSTGTICGVATGKDAKSMVIVGLFDLAENRRPTVER